MPIREFYYDNYCTFEEQKVKVVPVNDRQYLVYSVLNTRLMDYEKGCLGKTVPIFILAKRVLKDFIQQRKTNLAFNHGPSWFVYEVNIWPEDTIALEAANQNQRPESLCGVG